MDVVLLVPTTALVHAMAKDLDPIEFAQTCSKYNATEISIYL